MAFAPAQYNNGRLPRLAPEFYRGMAWVHWSMTLENRATGWLNDLHHARLREALVHAQVRYGVVCPMYCVMPDHAHFLWAGICLRSDQQLAARLFRTAWNRELRSVGHAFQRQGHDHVLREKESGRDAVMAVAAYIIENPMRAELVGAWKLWPYTGALVPGYPDLDPRDSDFWEKFWRIYTLVSDARAADSDEEAKA